MITEKRKEYMKKYRIEHREQDRINFNKWYKLHGKEYRKTHPHYKELIAIYQKTHKKQACTHSTVYQAIKKGLLTKPKHCLICKKNRYLHGHHSDYNKKLDVFWICASCHKKLHLGLIKT